MAKESSVQNIAVLNLLILLLFVVLIGVVIYLLIRNKKLLRILQDKEKLEISLQNKSETIEALGKELAKQMEYEIAQRLQSDNAYNYLFENTYNAVVITQEDLRIMKCNKASLRLFNKDALDCNILELFSDKEQKFLVYDGILKLKETKSRQSFRMDYNRQDSVVPVVVSIHLLDYAHKTTLYFTFTDISDIVRLESELQNKHIMLAQKTKEEEMGKMLGNIAHQWKQPLNALSLLCQNLKEMQKIGDLCDLEKYLQIMSDQIAFMSQTIDAFRAFYIPSKNTEAFEVQNTIQTMLDLFYKLVDKRIIIKLIPYKEQELLKICAIKNEFQQIILVLLDNAIDAVKTQLNKKRIKEGRIQISCAIQENIAKKRYCAISIRDNGGGISVEIANKIFNAFFTTKEQGSGIGLIVVKMLLEKMQGYISFTNDKEGVVFKIEIPLCEN